MYNAIPDRYQLASDFEQRANGFRFPSEVWNVAAGLAEAGGPTTPQELEKLTGLGLEQIREALGRLLSEKLVKQDLFTWSEYIAAKGESGGTAKSAPEVPQVVPVQPAPAEPVSPPSAPSAPAAAADKVPALTVTSSVKAVIAAAAPAAKPAQEGVGARLGSIAPKQGVATSPTNAWVIQKPSPAQVEAAKSAAPAPLPAVDGAGRLLRPILEQIEKVKGGGVEGQLLVYQVFLRVPYQLLHDEGIKALHFVNENTVIHNPALYAAIVKAAKDVAGIDLA